MWPRSQPRWRSCHEGPTVVPGQQRLQQPNSPPGWGGLLQGSILVPALCTESMDTLVNAPSLLPVGLLFSWSKFQLFTESLR